MTLAVVRSDAFYLRGLRAFIALEPLMDEVPCAIAVPAMNIMAAAEASSAPFLVDFIFSRLLSFF